MTSTEKEATNILQTNNANNRIPATTRALILSSNFPTSRGEIRYVCFQVGLHIDNHRVILSAITNQFTVL